MTKTYEKVLTAYNSIKHKVPFTPKIALVLGSGLGNFAENIKIDTIINYNDIEHFPISTVSGHKGRFVFGYINKNIPIVIMQGRVHYYEGYTIEDVVLPIRLIKMLGCNNLFLTNASGSVNKTYKAGDFMLITDHISNFVPSPLIGKNVNELGDRFCDMSEVYNKNFLKIIEKTAKELNISLKKGVYIQLTGPNFETKAEVDMCRILGADAVGMSTVCEAICANHMNMNICAISLISNLGCGVSATPLSAEEVYETAEKVAPLFEKLITAIIPKIV